MPGKQAIACFPGIIQRLFITVDSFWKIAAGFVNFSKMEKDISFCSPVVFFPGNAQALFITLDTFGRVSPSVAGVPASSEMFKLFLWSYRLSFDI